MLLRLIWDSHPGHGSFQYATQSFNVVNGDADCRQLRQVRRLRAACRHRRFRDCSGQQLDLTGPDHRQDQPGGNACVTGWLVVTMDDAIGAAQADTVSLSYTP